jgi:hypothetical protein
MHSQHVALQDLTGALLLPPCCSVRPMREGGREVGGGQLISCYRLLVVEHPQPQIVMNALLDNVSGPGCCRCCCCAVVRSCTHVLSACVVCVCCLLVAGLLHSCHACAAALLHWHLPTAGSSLAHAHAHAHAHGSAHGVAAAGAAAAAPSALPQVPHLVACLPAPLHACQHPDMSAAALALMPGPTAVLTTCRTLWSAWRCQK